MNYACATIICLWISSISQQALGSSLTGNPVNSTDNLMTVEKSLIVSEEAPSTNSGFVVSDVDHLEKSVFAFDNERNQSLHNIIEENSTVVIPEIANKSLERLNTSVGFKVQRNTTHKHNFTASPYLGSIPDEYMDKYRFTKNYSGGGNRPSPFVIGTVGAPIYFNAFSKPVNQSDISVINKELVNLGSKSYYNQKQLQKNESSIGNYQDVKPEESINSFPYHYEGGEPKTFHGSVSSGPDLSGIVSNNPFEGSGGSQEHSVENFNNGEDYRRVPVSPPPWMVPPHHEVSSNFRFPHINNPPNIDKPVRFEQNIESVVFTTELPRRGQLEAPSVSSGLYPVSHEQGYDVYSYGSTHKMSPMSQALKFLATIVPLGLFVAALTPTVVNVNATQGVMRRRPEVAGGGREVSDRLPSGAASSGLEAEQCDLREVCEAALRGVANNDSGTIEERVYWILAQKSPKTPLTTYALDELFSVIRKKSCSSFTCNALSQDAIDKWTTTTTTTNSPAMSVTQEISNTPNKIKRKKKKNPPVI